MKGLFVKDFHLMKTQKNFFLIVAVIVICFIVSSNGNTGLISYAIGFSCFVGSLFSSSTISYDEFDNGNAFLFSLPFTRKNYVLEKYCFGMILGFSCWIFSTGFAFVFLGFRNIALSEAVITSSGIFIPFFLLLLAVILPVTLKFGGEKSRFAIFGIFGIVLLLGFLITKAVRLLGIDPTGILNILQPFRPEVLTAVAAGITLLILLLSLKISISIVDRKEF